MTGMHRKSDSRWFTSDGAEHATREAAQRHERQLVLLRILRPHVQVDGSIRLADAIHAILDSKEVLVHYPAGAAR